MIDWPKDIVMWSDGVRQCMSVPFTWLLPKAQRYIDGFPGVWIVGGPAVYLMPDYIHGAQIGHAYPGVLQRINPQATRTSYGCPRSCAFCGVRTIAGPGLRELEDWPDLPIICDDNLTATSHEHFETVCRKLRGHDWCDFNQGLDCRLITKWHAEQLAKLNRPTIRMSLDSDALRGVWADAVEMLRTAGVKARSISTYVMVGMESESDAWDRCVFAERLKVIPCPMWFHRLNALRYGEINEEQERLGWTQAKKRRLFQFYYKHRGKRFTAGAAGGE